MFADHLPKTKNKYKNLKKQEIENIFIKTNLEKVCFQLDMAYGDFKDLPRRAIADKILCDKAFNIATNLKYDGYQPELALMVYKCFDKKTAYVADKSASGGVIKIAP